MSNSHPHGGARKVAAAISFAVAFFMISTSADAFVYWANERTDSIGRAANDGSRVDQEFITDAGTPCGVAVDADHIYWANFEDGSIGRAAIDGSDVDQQFITGANKPCGVAVDAAHVYWSNIGNGQIGRADLDGDGAVTLLGGASDPCGVAVNATNLFWANSVSSPTGGGIGRAALNGTSPNQAFIPSLPFPCGVAVDSQYLYWAGFGSFGRGSTIGRANLDGSSPDSSFVTNAGDGPCGIAVGEGSLFWANRSGDTIGTADVDGSGVDPNFVIDAERPCGVAVDALEPPPPSNRFRFGSPELNRRNGTARLPITVSEPGEAVIARSRLVEPLSARIKGAGERILRVKPTRKATRKLRSNGSVRVTVTVLFTPEGGETREKATRVRLVRR